MHWREQRHRGPDRTTAEATWAPALTLVATILLTACLGAMAVLQLEQFGPQVGAIVVFRPGAERMDLWHVSASAGGEIDPDPAGSAGTRACTLAPSAMAEGGGSLVVEARYMSSPPIYRVHWAGLRTSNGGDDCGKEANLILSRTDLQKLANTAGGFGIGPKTVGP
jgi:hypothetical protein